MAHKTGTTVDLAWLLDDLVGRVKQAEHAIVISGDGLLMARSREFDRDDAEHLAALAAGIQSLARGAGRRYGGGIVQQTIIEMHAGFLFVTAAGERACLAVLGAEDADVGLIAYEMNMLVRRARGHLTSPSRGASEPVGEEFSSR